MPTRQSRGRACAWVVAGCLASGCSTTAPVPLDPEAAAYREVLLHRRPAVYPGQVDVGGRYRSTLQVAAPEFLWSDQPGDGKCSGSLIAPNLVLTAAHCVCLKRPSRPEDSNGAPEGTAATKRRSPTRAKLVEGGEVDAIVEPSTCVKDAVVSAIFYEAPLPGAAETRQSSDYEGTVRVHPEAEILFKNGLIVRSNADLAVVELRAPLDGRLFPVYEMTDAEVKVGDRITFAGYGWEPKKFDYGKRRSGENEVSWIEKSDTGNVEIVAGAQTLADGGMASHIHLGDSGGGCFKADDNKVLVGVIASYAQNAKGDMYSIVTSTYANRLWLKRQIVESARRAARDGGTAVLPAVWRVDLATDAGAPSPHPGAGFRSSDAGSAR